MENETILTVEEAAQLLKVSKTTLRRWIKRGKVPVLKMARAYRIKKSDLDKLFTKIKPEV